MRNDRSVNVGDHGDEQHEHERQERDRIRGRALVPRRRDERLGHRDDCSAQIFARRFASVLSIMRFIATFTSGSANGSAAGDVSSNS